MAHGQNITPEYLEILIEEVIDLSCGEDNFQYLFPQAVQLQNIATVNPEIVYNSASIQDLLASIPSMEHEGGYLTTLLNSFPLNPKQKFDLIFSANSTDVTETQLMYFIENYPEETLEALNNPGYELFNIQDYIEDGMDPYIHWPFYYK